MSKKGNNKTRNKRIIIVATIVIIVILAIITGILLSKKNNNQEVVLGENNVEKVQDENITIVDVNSKSRPYAVVINNNHSAWPQCGVQDAYIVYEMIAEGGITRMLAIYKDQETAKIGSVRSARHYFLDYAQENDAIFVHWGGSPQAYASLSSIDSLDGIALEGTVFFRDNSLNRAYEHTGFTSMKNVKAYAEKQGYTRDTNKDLLLKYSASELNMAQLEGAKQAQDVNIEYSDYHTTSYEYDEENKVYKRSMSGVKNVDLETGKQYTAKNILIYKVENYTLNDGENKGRQELKNIGTGTGYLVTGGYVVPITWEKTSHSGQTVYKYTNGEEIIVNDGNTFIQICPTNAEITIK